MDDDAIRAFATRDRRPVERAKRIYWSERFRRGGSEATFRAGQEIRRFARALLPGWPSRRDRDRDLAHHLELKRALERAARAFPGR
jgi:hypothetical protein